MASASPKSKPKRSRKSGKKTAKIQKLNFLILRKIANEAKNPSN